MLKNALFLKKSPQRWELRPQTPVGLQAAVGFASRPSSCYSH